MSKQIYIHTNSYTQICMYTNLQDVDTTKLSAIGLHARCLTPLLRPLHVHCTFAKRSTWNWCLLSYMHNYFLSHLQTPELLVGRYCALEYCKCKLSVFTAVELPANLRDKV